MLHQARSPTTFRGVKFFACHQWTHIVSPRHQEVAKMRTNEATATCDQHPPALNPGLGLYQCGLRVRHPENSITASLKQGLRFDAAFYVRNTAASVDSYGCVRNDRERRNNRSKRTNSTPGSTAECYRCDKCPVRELTVLSQFERKLSRLVFASVAETVALACSCGSK